MEGSATRQALPAEAVSSPETYSREDVRRFLKVSERSLRSWEKQGLISAGPDFAFRDLIALKTLQQLQQNRISAPRIRRTIAALRSRLQNVTDPLQELRIYAHGRAIHVEIDGGTMESNSGQLLLDFKGPEIDKLLAFPQKENRQEATQKRALAEQWFEEALNLEQAGAPVQQVREAYERVLTVDPDSTGTLVNLGTLHFHARSMAKAEKCYRRALEVDPEYALAHFNLANLYDERGDREQAVTHYREALRIAPAYPDAHYNLALLLQGQGKTMEAVSHWKNYLKLDPSSSWAEIARRELEKLKSTTLLKMPGPK